MLDLIFIIFCNETKTCQSFMKKDFYDNFCLNLLKIKFYIYE